MLFLCLAKQGGASGKRQPGGCGCHVYGGERVEGFFMAYRIYALRAC